MSTPAESRWRNATRQDRTDAGAWWALYRHACAGCHHGIYVGEMIEYARGEDGNVPAAGPRYRHARPTCRGRWQVKLELRPWHDAEGGYVPSPAVWTVRQPGGLVVFVTSDARTARLVADARAHGRSDPIADVLDGGP